MKKLRTDRHDIAGNEFIRVVRLNLLNKYIPIGNFKRGVGYKPILTLMVSHYLGKPLFYIVLRYERVFNRLYRFLRRGG